MTQSVIYFEFSVYNVDMKLSAWAKLNSVSYRTAIRHFKAGAIAGAYQLPTGTIVVPGAAEVRAEYVAVYARVSSSENKGNLEAQAERVSAFCAAKGWIVKEVVKEVGSGVNDARPKLLSLIKNPAVTRIVVEHKDRLTRFGFNYIKALFEGEIVVINEVATGKEDLVQDFVSVITSFCARIYGNRRSKRATEKLIKELDGEKE